MLRGGKSLHFAHQQCFGWTSREADVELSRPGNFVQLMLGVLLGVLLVTVGK